MSRTEGIRPIVIQRVAFNAMVDLGLRGDPYVGPGDAIHHTATNPEVSNFQAESDVLRNFKKVRGKMRLGAVHPYSTHKGTNSWERSEMRHYSWKGF